MFDLIVITLWRSQAFFGSTHKMRQAHTNETIGFTIMRSNSGKSKREAVLLSFNPIHTGGGGALEARANFEEL